MPVTRVNVCFSARSGASRTLLALAEEVIE
jgi:hypothetical protein